MTRSGASRGWRSAWLLLAVALVLPACATEPVDRFCGAVRRAADGRGWSATADRPGLVAAAWRGEAVDDPFAPILEFDGLRPWHRAGTLDELAAPGTRRERRCETARGWLAESSWRRFGLVVAVEGELLVVIGADGSPEEPEGWPPTAEELASGRVAGLAETLEAHVGGESRKASLHLPDRTDLTLGLVRLLVATLVGAGFDEPDVYYTDRAQPLRLGPSAPPASAGPQLVVTLPTVAGGGVQAYARVDVAGRSIPLATPDGCALVALEAGAHGGVLESQLAAALGRFGIEGGGRIEAPPDQEVASVIEALGALRIAGVEPARVVAVSDPAAGCEGGVLDAAGLAAALDEEP